MILYSAATSIGSWPKPCAGFGAVLIVAVILLVLGPWRERHDDVFPMHVLDLSAPPAAIERAQPPASPHGAANR